MAAGVPDNTNAAANAMWSVRTVFTAPSSLKIMRKRKRTLWNGTASFAVPHELSKHGAKRRMVDVPSVFA
jgi:hypothetical protein